MMKFALAVLALCFTAWGQSQNLLNITPKQDNSATGAVRFFELFSNGQNYVGLKAPNSLTGNTTYTLPSAFPAATGDCLTSTTAGVTSWAACDSLWSTDGTHVWRPSGRVGIGTATPGHPLDINSTGSQIHVRNSALNEGGYITSNAASQLLFGGGVDWNGSQLTARATTASMIELISGEITFFGNTGLTVGSSVSPVSLWKMNSSALQPGAHNTYSLGTDSIRPLTVFGVNADFAPSGAVGNYAKFRKLEIAGATGETTFWDVQAAASMAANSWFKVRDNAGSRLFVADRATSGTPLNGTRWFTSFAPAKRATVDGDAVNDSVFPALGDATAPWSIGHFGGDATGFYDAINVRNTTVGAYGSCVVLSATDSVSSAVYGAGRICGRYTSNNFSSEEITIQSASGSGTYNNAITIFNGDTTINGFLNGDFGATFNGAVTGNSFNGSSTNPYRVAGTTVIDASRNATFVNLTLSGTCTGCGSGLPVIDTTAVVKGSVDATKLLAFEVDGFTTGTTRTLTPQNASYTIAGTDIAQTFTGAQTFNSGTNTSDLTPRADLTYVVGNGGARYSAGHFNNLLIYNELQAFSGSENIGSTSTQFGNLYIGTVNVYGTVIPNATNTRNLGSSTRVWNKTWTNDFQVNGTVTAPNGNAGQSATITVRDAAGTGTCTLIFSGGIKTGGTC